jgi:hypothetical protein
MQLDRPFSEPTSVDNKLANVADAGIQVLRNNFARRTSPDGLFSNGANHAGSADRP